MMRFEKAPHRDVDWSSEEGALALAEWLRTHWQRRGHHPHIWVEQVDWGAASETKRHPVWAVRSDLVVSHLPSRETAA